MNLEQAKKVLWLKNNHRPLGDLLDEGYLTRERLEWAATWAYSSKLQEAAKAILDSMGSGSSTINSVAESQAIDPQGKAFQVDISLDKARSTPWPFSPYKGQPMGVLVESKKLSLKDLGFAVENAWDEKVRKAAIALTLTRLEQAVKEPIPSAGFVHAVSGGRSFSERRESLLTLLLGMMFGFPIAWIMYVVFGLMTDYAKPSSNTKQLVDMISTPAGIIAISFLIFVTLLAVWLFNFVFDWIAKRFEKKIDEYRLGQEGEDKTVQQIVQVLDGSWHLFRNVSIPGRNKGDLDIVLIGPPGVWVLEVKNFRGEYRNTGDNWEYRSGKQWKKAFTSPSAQANNNALRLKNFLKADSLNIYVNEVVIWANQEKPLLVENPSVAVWKYDHLADELGNIWQGEKLTKTEQDKIVEKLTKLCDSQKKSG